LQSPIALDWLPDGSLAVLDAGNAKVLRLNLGGTVLDDRPVDPKILAVLLSGGMMWSFLAQWDIIGQPGPRPTGSGQGELLIVRGQELGVRLDTVARRTVDVFRPGNLTAIPLPGEAIPVATVYRDSLIAIADEAHYRIRFVNDSGTTVRQVCRREDPVPFSRIERSGLEGVTLPGVAEDLEDVAPSHQLATIGRLLAGGEGRLWVQRSRPAAGSPMDRIFGPEGAQFEILDSAGSYMGTVVAPARIRLIAASRHGVIGLKRGEMDELSLVGYKLPPFVK
jgi:hypothetical protein